MSQLLADFKNNPKKTIKKLIESQQVIFCRVFVVSCLPSQKHAASGLLAATERCV
jgi:hypothetical protein